MKKKAADATISAAKMSEFPNLNQRELAGFLGIDPKRLERATHAGIVMREGSLYPLGAATAQWLAYERSQNSRSKHRSALEREKAAFTKARRELVQLQLATLRGEMVNVNEAAGALKAVCLARRRQDALGPAPLTKRTGTCGKRSATNDTKTYQRPVWESLPRMWKRCCRKQ